MTFAKHYGPHPILKITNEFGLSNTRRPKMRVFCILSEMSTKLCLVASKIFKEHLVIL